ncbi:12594_t:CDS:1 [Dentiscutata erythropus]|uniref:12594_t:CDS:1 n=1 Tax=Dentiscutata erythropus TaxID=1348616 RepID=A0A9N9IYG0_9GLOM|nr:12594_t:CDS:1 [Dentiscutata erythropus]
MVNANEWLNEKIPKDQRAQAAQLHIYKNCQNGHTTYSNGCNYCNNRNKNPHSGPPNYQFYNTTLEGELDLNDFVNLQYLYLHGTGQGQKQQQMITNLKIDKCNKLIYLQIWNTPASNIKVGEYKQLIADCNRLKSQVEELTSVIRNIKGSNVGDLKLAAKKVEEKNLENQVSVTKSKLNEDYQLWVDLLLDTQQEVLQNDNAFARKQLEKVKKRLSSVLTAEEIQELLGKIVEINELEIQLNNIKIQTGVF